MLQSERHRYSIISRSGGREFNRAIAAGYGSTTEAPQVARCNLQIQKVHRELIVAWLRFWIRVWAGTSVAGSCFGFLLGADSAGLGNPNELVANSIMGMFIGFAYAALVAASIMPTLIAVLWTLNLIRAPKRLACVAGGLVGTVCMPYAFFVTGTMGALGAYWASRQFLTSPEAEPIVQAERIRLSGEPSTLHFSLLSLFARMTVIAIVVAFWTTVFRVVMSEFQLWGQWDQWQA